jgi:uncharacterized protein YxeA
MMIVVVVVVMVMMMVWVLTPFRFINNTDGNNVFLKSVDNYQ